ncbi:MAG: hypothetical protein R3C53_23285 [Pirellulaceae bacterium]
MHYLAVDSRLCILACSILLSPICVEVCPAQSPIVRELGKDTRIELKLEPTPHFVISGISAQNETIAEQQVTFCVDGTELTDPPRVLGEYRLVGQNGFEFHPRFPLSQAVVYRANFAANIASDLKIEPSDKRLLFALPKRPTSTPRIAQVYPSADNLPENLLKFYIYFSQPMSRGEAYRRIKLMQGTKVVNEPFLELGEELWDGQQTRFTLFLHPGRIKRGVQPRELNGPPLTSGNDYLLKIDGTWQSADGVPLGKAFEKKFKAVAAEHKQVDPLKWQLDSPSAGTLNPVQLTFDRPMDQAMLQHALVVKFHDELVTGQVELGEFEQQWRFIPDAVWKVGAYQIEVATNLEDLCGNNLAAPFEVKLKNSIGETPASMIAVEFIVK